MRNSSNHIFQSSHSSLGRRIAARYLVRLALLDFGGSVPDAELVGLVFELGRWGIYAAVCGDRGLFVSWAIAKAEPWGRLPPNPR